MSRVFFTADTHFNHDFVAATRGFDNAEQHDEALITRFNSLLTKRDHLWILGDLGMGSLGKVLEQAAKLNGIKHLVFGNHDAGHPMRCRSAAQQRRYLEVFESVHLHEQVRIGNHRVNLSHFPYEGDRTDADRYDEWRLRKSATPLLHGHVHDAFVLRGNGLNVGYDKWSYPVSADELSEWVEAQSFYATNL